MYRSMQKPTKAAQGADATSRSRGRPRAFDRQAALAQATRLFWVQGYEATSIADLTQAIGIGGPSLYAAFGSKEALYAEALRHYAETNEHLVWAAFHAADTARDAVLAFLMDSAAALTGCVADLPRGCMVTLSSVGSEGYAGLGEIVRTARGVTLERLQARLARAVKDGEIAASADLHALARFVQTVQAGMSILARDGATRSELADMAGVAMAGWDARTQGGR
jgi:AcrR family transcriptional regulator